MALKILVVILIINIALALALLASRRPGKEKAVWTTVLLAIPLTALAVYRFMSQKDRTASLKDWESR